MPDREPITRELLRSILDYDPGTGVLTWKLRVPRPGLESIDRAWNTRCAGKEAGALHTSGYRFINLMGRPRCAHRLIFTYMTGEHPECVDHANRIKSDNRWSNLRAADKSQNAANSKVRADNASGATGVCWSAGRWQVSIQVNGESVYLGRYDDKTEAFRVRRDAELKYFGAFAHWR